MSQPVNFNGLRAALKSGETTLPKLLEDYLKRIHAQNPEINAIIGIDVEKARNEAHRIQEKIETGSAGSLAGAIIGIKDNICEAGVQATCGSNILRNFVSTYDSTAVAKLKEADALLLGRMNLDEFAMGSSTEYTIFGPTKNPRDTSRVPGGSSGGSAAAVAANFCTMALGSDTGGSIRQPASYCGVVGLKPTYGRVSRYGLIAYASSFDSIGPLTHNVKDAATVLNVIAGRDEHDMTSANVPAEDFRRMLKDGAKGLKIGVYDGFLGDGLDAEVKDTVEKTINALKAAGAEIVPISFNNIDYGISVYYILATAEASSNLARFDGIRYGHRADSAKIRKELAEEKAKFEQLLKAASSQEEKQSFEQLLGKVDSTLNRLYKGSRSEGFGEEVKRRIMLGTYVLSAGYYDAYYAKAQKMRRLLKEEFQAAYKKVDVIISPTAPTTAFKIGDNHDDPIQMYLNDIYTITANLTGGCSISVPVETHSNGLPIGVQLMAAPYNEALLLRAAQCVEDLKS